MVGQGTTDLDRESQTLRLRKRLYFQIRQEMSINEVWNQGRQICSQELYHLATSQVSVVQFNQGSTNLQADALALPLELYPSVNYNTTSLICVLVCFFLI